MTSRAYRASSSSAENHRALSLDEGNDLLWRQNLRRLEAEAIRDTMLAVSGTLNPKRGGPSVFPELPKEVHGTQDSSGKGWADSPPEEQNRRSVYLVVKRALKVPLLVAQGRADSVVLPAMAEHVLATCPTAEASWYEGTGHVPHLEEPGRFNRELAELTRRVRA